MNAMRGPGLVAELARLSGGRVIVLGDVMLDTFVYGDCVRVSPEAPIPVLRVERDTTMLGGAGNVARNIAALGGAAVLIGIIGDDAAGTALRTAIAAEPAITADLVIDGRPTTHKTRYVAGGQQMLRTDVEANHPADPDALYAAITRHIDTATAVVLSDYGKGVLSPTLLSRLIVLARARGIPVVADPKSADVGRYNGVTLLTPNALETAAATGLRCDRDADAEEAGTRLLAAMPETAAVLVTRGARGMTLVRRDVDNLPDTSDTALHLPAVARAVFDVSGAGDTVVATIALALAAGVEIAAGVELANVAAGLAVSKPGTAVITPAEIAHELRSTEVDRVESKIVTLTEALADIARWRTAGERIGFTNGCFDLVHPGHVSQLVQARSQCDRLIVGLNSDASIQRLKGPTRPVQPETARAIVLSSLAAVDRVIVFAEDTPIDLITAIRPDVLVKGKDYQVEAVVGADIVQAHVGRVFLADLVEGFSTTAIISRLMEGTKP